MLNMGELIQFKKKKISEKHKGNTLCRSGFHKWDIINKQQFDVKKGKLVTVYQCYRCQKTKSKLL